MKKILAIASAGGHWVQLLRLRKAFDGCSVLYVTTMKELKAAMPNERIEIVPDASRDEKLKLLALLVKVFLIILRNRPDVIITTGAAPGVFALKIGKLFGAKTIWIDSIANAEELSLSGRLVAHNADLVLTQWPHIAAREKNIRYEGEVI
ncbi:hypothetical protein [Hydrocarboniphaga effusa]|uniref:hypothetical protein n=1 Tax=Hydrocarboniphaga effusa TaxID=243629 RepID=UPI003BAAB541